MTEVTRPNPYIGISGIATIEQHKAIHNMACQEYINRFGHFAMIGIQATNKTQILEIENKRGRLWHPVSDEISSVAFNDESGLTRPYVHCYFENDAELAEGLDIIMKRTSHYCRGIQINGLSWIANDYRNILESLRDKYPNNGIILQVNREMMDKHTPSQIADALIDSPVDYVLFDPSGGFGIEMEIEKMRPFVDKIYEREMPGLGVAISGGLEAKNLEELFAPLVEVYMDLSCDAEGKLRKGQPGKTEIDLKAVEEYLLVWNAIQGRM